jgi:hypothetical protein
MNSFQDCYSYTSTLNSTICPSLFSEPKVQILSISLSLSCNICTLTVRKGSWLLVLRIFVLCSKLISVYDVSSAEMKFLRAVKGCWTENVIPKQEKETSITDKNYEIPNYNVMVFEDRPAFRRDISPPYSSTLNMEVMFLRNTRR